MATEPDQDDAPSLEIMRQAAREYIGVHGLRAFTRAIGMKSPSGVAQMVNGESAPRATTLRMLQTWYLEWYVLNAMNGAAAGAGVVTIQVLLRDLPRRRQRAAALRLRELLCGLYGQFGERVPRWVSDMNKLMETEWSE